jgi:hypothetical protein
MLFYRPPRVGDLIAVRSNDPYGSEQQVQLDSVIDNGRTVLMSGSWQGQRLEVLLRRVGDIEPLSQLE